jgi:hypothetical protein
VIAVADSDGAIYAEAEYETVEDIDRALSEAAAYFQEREIIWTPSFPGGMSSARDRSRLALVAFGEDVEPFRAALKALEDRTLVKYHNQLIFIRQGLDSDAARKFAVTESPTLLLLDPTAEEAAQERGRVTKGGAAEFKAAIKAALQKRKEETEESR